MLKRFGFIVLLLVLFAAGLSAAYWQGGASFSGVSDLQETALEVPLSSLVYSGWQAKFAMGFIASAAILLKITGGSMALTIVLMAFLAELVLLYPGVRLQLKQKKIHLFHKKLVDRFRDGELSYSQTEQELHKLYAVNQKIHARGAIFVTIQILVFLAAFWGLNLMARAPHLLSGSWSIFNFSLLAKPSSFFVPLIVGLLYFLHALLKIVVKEREDYISPAQTTVSLILAVLASSVIAFFASHFAVALSLFLATLITFTTVRYFWVERHARAWGELAQKELIEMLRHAEPYRDRFEYASHRWNHLPIVRYINFHLLEEAISMTLGLLLAMNFFGIFQKGPDFSAAFQFRLPVALADFPTDTYRACTPINDLPVCTEGIVFPRFVQFLQSLFNHQAGFNLANPDQLYRVIDFSPPRGDVPRGVVHNTKYSFRQKTPTDSFSSSCCFLDQASGLKYQVVKPSASIPVGDIITKGIVACGNADLTCAMAVSQLTCKQIPGCSWNNGVCQGAGHVYFGSCNYQFDNIPHVRVTGCQPNNVRPGDTINLTGDGGSGTFKWKVIDTASGAILAQAGDGINKHNTYQFVVPAIGGGFAPYNIVLEDYFNPLNSSETQEQLIPATSCKVQPEPALRIQNCADAQASNGLSYSAGQGGTGTFAFKADGCTTDCVWNVANAVGSIDAATGLYKAPAGIANGQAMIELKKKNSIQSDVCAVNFTFKRIELDPTDQPAIILGGQPVQLIYKGGPGSADWVQWELVSGPGALDIKTGIYTPSKDPAHATAQIEVKVTDKAFPTNLANVKLPYVNPVCNPDFGIYDFNDQKLTSLNQISVKKVFDKGTYRLFIKNAFLPKAYDWTVLVDNYNLIASAAPGFSAEKKMPYLDFQFIQGNGLAGKTAVIKVEDKSAHIQGRQCFAALVFEHAGTGIRLQVPKKINVGF